LWLQTQEKLAETDKTEVTSYKNITFFTIKDNYNPLKTGVLGQDYT
jgi:hypothetical protein